MSSFTPPSAIPAVTLAKSSDINQLSDSTATAFALLPNEYHLQQGKATLATAVSFSANVYTLTVPHFPQSGDNIPAYQDGGEVVFKASASNTGACSVLVKTAAYPTGFGTRELVQPDGTALLPDDIKQDSFVTIRYHAVNQKFYVALGGVQAKDWATKTNGLVATVDYSAKAWATGGTGVDTLGGSAKDWATKTTGTVGNTALRGAKFYSDNADVQAANAASSASDANAAKVDAIGNALEALNWSTLLNALVPIYDETANTTSTIGSDYSSKEYAIGASVESAKRHASGTTATGSAKDWATQLTTEVVTAQGYSARQYAANSASSATSSATQAGLSASSATASANSATASATSETNSASSATSSATQAGLSASSATASANSATASANSATAAESSAIAAAASFDSFDDRYLGAKAADPTLDNDGLALMTGAMYWNSVNNVMKVWTGSVWQVNYTPTTGFMLAANNLSDVTNAATARANLAAQAALVSGVNIKTVGGVTLLGTGNITTDYIPLYLAYDSRGTLRTTVSANGSLHAVESLGLFRYVTGLTTEPDDDETCFVTVSGSWLLENPHWDFIDATMLADESEQNDRAEDLETRATSLETRFSGRILFGTATSSGASIPAVSQQSFTGTVTGALVGDSVLVTPPHALTGAISLYARVSSSNTITVYLNNPSAAAQTPAAGIFQLAIFRAS